MQTPDDVLTFWFEELTPEEHFNGGTEIDEEIRERFGKLHTKAAAGELYDWRETLYGRLAEIIILDQFSRNLYRGEAKAFAQDKMALALAQECLRNCDLSTLESSERAFLYMPFMHSESLVIHEIAMKLFSSEPDLKENLKYEISHKETLEEFGRYPYRNKALGRKNTPAEEDYLKETGY